MRRILITRPRAQADAFAEKLQAAGFEPIFFPVIEIHPIESNIALERALSKINCYEWIVFTSANAVEVVFLPPSSLRDFGEKGGSWRGVKIAAIGPKTAASLQKHNIEPDFIPDKYVGEAIMAGLGDVKGKWILLPRAEIARKELPEAIAHAGGVPHEITVYRTLPAKLSEDDATILKSGIDMVTFTSASTVDNFVALTRQHKLDPLNLPNNPLIACIGPITEQAAREVGFQNIVTAKEYTTDGLIEAIVKMERS